MHDAEIIEDIRTAWSGPGLYAVEWSDGGQPWTADGPVWYDDRAQLMEELRAAYLCATEAHTPYVERVGGGMGC